MGLKVFCGSASASLASDVTKLLGVSLGKMDVTKFSDGETRVVLNESVRGSNCFIIQSTSTPVNENLMELFLLIDALKRASAKKIVVVMPYYGYARQDRLVDRSCVSAKVVANFLQASKIDALVTIDLHSSQITGFFDIPIDDLKAANLFADYFKKKNLKDAVVVSPDAGGVVRARKLAELLNAPFAIIYKHRPAPNSVGETRLIGDVKGKNCIMIDDMVDTGGSLAKASQALIDGGAKKVFACATHAVLSGKAMENLSKSSLQEVVFTNTISHKGLSKKFVFLSIAPLLAETIKRIDKDKSVSELFEQWPIGLNNF
ncbi:ribose-phosphate pyrophosphokinase [Candidatus Micrarchaeota archaeon]|nr:ribose-phosphate pyrophosphokinase [Candidatus Micrarchaeota archaeon]